LSPAPQAEPQAAGAVFGLSEAPQAAGVSAGAAAPQAAGASAGLSEEPQELPHAAAGAEAAFLFHPKRFISAIIVYLQKMYSAGSIALCSSYYRKKIVPAQVRTFL
jgi:hypothetical protein